MTRPQHAHGPIYEQLTGVSASTRRTIIQHVRVLHTFVNNVRCGCLFQVPERTGYKRESIKTGYLGLAI